MIRQLPLVSAVLSVLSSAHAQYVESNSTINWQPCEQHNTTLPVFCGTLSVPFDYTDTDSNKTISLALVRVKANKEPFRGSIIFNPGGPGGDGTDFINGPTGADLLRTTGGHHDLIGFDTRGTGDSAPFSCYKDELGRTIASLRAPLSSNVSDAGVGTEWAYKQTLAINCYNNARELGEVLGTAFIARDMMQIVDALGEDGLLRYWGFSYGTILGATAAAMFPDRMDKVILDAVVNPTQWYEGRDVEQLTDSDATWAGFFEGCLAAPPGNCALASPGATAKGLEQQIIDLLDELKYNPRTFSLPELSESSVILDYGIAKGSILQFLYSPALWPALALAFNGLLHDDDSVFVALLQAYFASADPKVTEFNAGIRCADSELRTDDLTEIQPLIDEIFDISYVIGDFQVAGPTLTCPNWRIKPRERYSAGFHDIKTKNPLLFIGNTFDPLTPLVSARNASAAFEGSAVLQHNGYGHSSLAQPSLCTANAIAAYFVNGTLPEDGAKCEPDLPLFATPPGANDTAAGIAGIAKRDAQGDDVQLLAAVKRIGERFAERSHPI